MAGLHERICVADGCSRMIKAKGRAEGFCQLHYQERLHALATSGERSISRDGPCLVKECPQPRRSRGLCSAHYAASRRRGACPACGNHMNRTRGLCLECHRAALVAQMPTEKTCRRCERTLPIASFSLRKSAQGSAKWRSRCSECEATDSRIRAKAPLRDRSKDGRTASYLSLRRYAESLGIPWADVVERYPADNRCEICGRGPEEANPGGRFARLSLDHCHETNRLRGFLCGPCNSGVGYLGDTPKRLRSALRYLLTAERVNRPDTHDVDQDTLPGT